MVPRAIADVVSRLLEEVETEPTTLPIAAIADAHRTGHDIAVDRSGPGAVVYVSPRPGAHLTGLTKREREVAMLAAGGFSNQQIATALFISLATVKDHMHAVLRKSGLDSRAQLIASWYGGLAAPTTAAAAD